MVYFANLCVNLRGSLCPASAGPRLRVTVCFLDVLDLDEISSFLNWKRQYVPILKQVNPWMGTNYPIVTRTLVITH